MPLNNKSDFSFFKKKLLKAFLFIGIGIGFNFAISPWIKIGINSGHSVDGLVFIILKKERATKGQLMAFWPPENRFYKNIWFVKYIKGFAGDRVSRKDQNFYVNGEYTGSAKKEASNGQPLEPAQIGEIPKGKFFVWSAHKDSYDSRYKDIGWINENRIIGRAIRLF